jgi:hypothetical protein
MQVVRKYLPNPWWHSCPPGLCATDTADHPRTAAQFVWQHPPRDAAAKDKQNAHEARSRNVPSGPKAVFEPAPPGTLILNLKRSAHTGDIFGAPTQAIYLIVGLGIAVQTMTGGLIWWNARKGAFS